MAAILSPEDEADIASVLKELREDNAFEEGNEGYDVARAMLTGAHLGTGNPDKVAAVTGLNRDKVREWFKNLRASNIIEVGKDGRSTGVWRVGWFGEHGFLALIMEILCAQGLLVRTDPVEESPPQA